MSLVTQLNHSWLMKNGTERFSIFLLAVFVENSRFFYTFCAFFQG